ncbi:hypothetical protein Lalb_Chr08g0236161 [Lupinus albus]|uniref:S-protein homolog n=1 Tax=Lupinus albus TaxID=3870 RepID=A0A6A4Q4E6_LUPAL|nr:hypothetical protein Lalb_Chr08g0236151 [Lupinus albus]KAE9608484.1 hypothetical protein Lalb_Chr08g0236161 [Lupinus albus]
MMVEPNIRLFMFCLLLLLPSNLMAISTKINLNPFPRIHVYIKNGVAKGTNLTLHCKSKDDDLGVHYLNYQEEYTFSFHYNVFALQGYTLFFCGFTWNHILHWFEIYNWKRDRYFYTNMRWTIQENSPCLFNHATNNYDICDFAYNQSNPKLLYNLY